MQRKKVGVEKTTQKITSSKPTQQKKKQEMYKSHEHT